MIRVPKVCRNRNCTKKSKRFFKARAPNHANEYRLKLNRVILPEPPRVPTSLSPPVVWPVSRPTHQASFSAAAAFSAFFATRSASFRFSRS